LRFVQRRLHVAILLRSSARVTAIMNRNTKDISTDLLLRVRYSLGYTAKIKFQKPVSAREVMTTRAPGEQLDSGFACFPYFALSYNRP